MYKLIHRFFFHAYLRIPFNFGMFCFHRYLHLNKLNATFTRYDGALRKTVQDGTSHVKEKFSNNMYYETL